MYFNKLCNQLLKYCCIVEYYIILIYRYILCKIGYFDILGKNVSKLLTITGIDFPGSIGMGWYQHEREHDGTDLNKKGGKFAGLSFWWYCRAAIHRGPT